MSTILKTVDVEIELSPIEIAHVLCGMDSDYQVAFFNALGDVAGSKLPFQLQSVTDSDHLTADGRHVMGMIGDYASPNITYDNYKLKEEREQLGLALQSLYDVQNGSPVMKYKADYEAAMAKAEEALAAFRQGGGE